jgi:hypothetical protein
MSTENDKANRKRLTGFSLGDQWISMLERHSWQTCVKPLIAKERGQLKMLANGLGPRTREVMAFAIEHWNRFAMTAASYAGLATYPERPHIGFLLAHYDVAVNILQSDARLAAVDKQAPSALASSRLTVIKRSEETPDGPSPEEIAALIDKLSNGGGG